MGGNAGGGGTSITVQIIDACPSTSASNFCKTDIPANQHCNAPGVNALDIDNSAYAVLTGGGAPGVRPSFPPLLPKANVLTIISGQQPQRPNRRNLLPRQRRLHPDQHQRRRFELLRRPARGLLLSSSAEPAQVGRHFVSAEERESGGAAGRLG